MRPRREAGTDTERSSRGPREELGQADQIERGTREHQEPVDVRQPAELDLAHPGDGLQPPERGFDARPRMLTLRIPDVTGRAAVKGAAAGPLDGLGDLGRRVQLADEPDKIPDVIGLVGPTVRRRPGDRSHCRQTITVAASRSP